jgi:hypothetical protein
MWTGGWSQDGSKLVGAGAVGGAYQGLSIALFGDGNTAVAGDPGDNGFMVRVVLHPKRRGLEPARQQAGRHRCGWSRRPRPLRGAVRRWPNRYRSGDSDKVYLGAAWGLCPASIASLAQPTSPPRRAHKARRSLLRRSNINRLPQSAASRSPGFRLG